MRVWSISISCSRASRRLGGFLAIMLSALLATLARRELKTV